MTPDAPTLDPQELLAHSAWVQALAQRLLEGGALAEDVVQETWLAALKRPPRSVASLRPWLASVVRNLVRLQVRGDERRVRRERDGAAPERLPSAAQLVEHEAERKRLVDRVVALPEPYRTTVLLRFWNQQTPDAIARRLGVPPSTVRNRLKRALDRIRRDLDRDGRASRTLRCILAFAPMGARAPAGPWPLATLGALTAMSKSKLIGATLVLLVGTLGATLLPDFLASPRPEALPPPAALADASAPTVEELPLAGVRDPVAVAVVPPAEVAPPPAPSFRIVGAVRDERGDPVDEALVCFVREDATTRFALSRGAEGYAIRDLEAGPWRVVCSKADFLDTEAEVTLTEKSDRFDWVLHPAPAPVGVRFLTETGEPLAKSWRSCNASSLFFDLAVVATAQPPPATVDLIDPTDPFGCGVYRAGAPKERPDCDGQIAFSAPLPLFVSAVLRDVVLESQWIERDAKEVTFRLPSDAVRARGATIEFDVADASDGHRLPECHVSTSTVHVVHLGVGRKENGHVVLENEPFGPRGLWVRAKGYAPYYADLDLAPGEHRDLGTIRLAKGTTIRGRVVARDGAAPPTFLHDWDLERATDARESTTQIVFAETDAKGNFEITVPAGRRLVVASPREGYGWAAAAVDTRAGPVDDLKFVVEPAVPLTLAVKLVGAELVRIRDGQGLPLWSEWSTSRPRTLALSPGRYTVETLRVGGKPLARPLEVDPDTRVVPIFDAIRGAN